MSQAYFITGTDTEIGKTYVACALLHRARQQGMSAVGLKPVAAGLDERGLNEDVEQLKSASSIVLSDNLINPYRFSPAIAPHIAAAEAGVRIDFSVIQDACRQAGTLADIVIVEGVGGFRVPLGETLDGADLAKTLGLPVILVVGMRLGCLNHALLTVDAILQSNLILSGWVANTLQPDMPRFKKIWRR